MATVRNRDVLHEALEHVREQGVEIPPAAVHRRPRDAGAAGDRLDRQAGEPTFLEQRRRRGRDRVVEFGVSGPAAGSRSPGVVTARSPLHAGNPT